MFSFACFNSSMWNHFLPKQIMFYFKALCLHVFNVCACLCMLMCVRLCECRCACANGYLWASVSCFLMHIQASLWEVSCLCLLVTVGGLGLQMWVPVFSFILPAWEVLYPRIHFLLVIVYVYGMARWCFDIRTQSAILDEVHWCTWQPRHIASLCSVQFIFFSSFST